MPFAPVSKDRFDLPATLWVVGVIAASLGLSDAFACATPFAAVAAFGALTLRSRAAVVLTLGVWLGNQAIGFGLLHYPQDASTFAWGGAIGMAALAALAAARGSSAIGGLPRLAAPAVAFVAAFAAYELVLYAATSVLASGADAFAPDVVWRIFLDNAVALGLLMAARSVASLVGVLPPPVAQVRA